MNFWSRFPQEKSILNFQVLKTFSPKKFNLSQFHKKSEPLFTGTQKKVKMLVSFIEPNCQFHKKSTNALTYRDFKMMHAFL